MFIDSHCHLDFPDLADNATEILANMKTNKVSHALVVSVSLDRLDGLLDLVQQHDNLFASVGVHPDYEDTEDPSVEQLIELSKRTDKVIAIGETGLDYFRKPEPLDWQRQRFRNHIQASVATNLPLIIHTRAASQDTIQIMKEENASAPGGVMHCFTESWEVAKQAMDLNFYISLSGIVTFKNAVDLQEVAKKIPLDRLLIETDAPFLAPVPHRGKTNDPSKVIHVAEKIAELRNEPVEKIAEYTTNNFFNLFKHAKIN